MKPQHPSERSFDFDTPAGLRLASSPLIEAACRCYCWSSSEASTATSDNRIAATDQAIVQTADLSLSKSTVAADAIIAGGNVTSLDFKGARVGDDNSSQVQDSTIVGGDVLTNNLDFAGARIGDETRTDFSGSKIGSSEIGSITITDTGGEILTDALDRVTQFATLAESGRQTSLAGILALGQRSEQNRADADANTGDTLAALLDATTAAKEAADPEAQKNKTILWIVLAMLAFLFFRRT